MTAQPRETWVMVLSDVQPDSIGLDGRHTPKITKGRERKRGVEREEGREGAKRSIKQGHIA